MSIEKNKLNQKETRIVEAKLSEETWSANFII